MSGLLQSSKVIIVEEEPRVRGIPSAPTSVAGAVGITERGPLGEAVLCSSFDEYQAKFGDFTADSDLALAAMGFYENGGSQLWVVRTAHYADAANPATTTAVRASGFLLAGGGPTPASLAGVASGPFALQPGDSLRLVVDGAPAADAVFEGTPASLATTAPGPFVLTDGMELRLRVDGGTEQSIRTSPSFSQSVFYDKNAATAVILRDIGNNKYMSKLDNAEWKALNSKFEGATVINSAETKTILGYECKKAVLQLKDGNSFNIYYATNIIPSVKEFEYQFKDIPGFVLEYEALEMGGKKIKYTATKINLSPVPVSKFEIPTSGYRMLN